MKKNVLRRARLLVPTLLVSSLLALGAAPSAKADAIYSYNDTLFGSTWSFEVPIPITTTTTITGFLSTNIVAGGLMASLGCTAIDSVEILNPSGASANVTTHCTPIDIGFLGAFSGPINTFGTFKDFTEEITLTITPSTPSGVPEPSSLLLLAGGLAGLGLRRRWFV